MYDKECREEKPQRSPSFVRKMLQKSGIQTIGKIYFLIDIYIASCVYIITIN